MGETLVKVEGVSKKFCRNLKESLWYGLMDLGSELVGKRHDSCNQLRQNEFWAVRDVSFELKRGECLGLIGRNGAGKTTLLRLLNGLIRPDLGRVEIHGRVGALIALGTGFNPILTGRENIYVNAAILGLSKGQTDAKLDEIIDFAEIGESIDAPVQSYSSGMQVRLGFAIATTIEPDVLILDEVLAVGDIRFRKKCYSAIGRIKKNCATIIVNHNLSHIAQMCDSGMVLGMDNSTPKVLPIDQAIASYASSFSSGATQERFHRDSSSPIVSIKLDHSAVSASIGADLAVIATFESDSVGPYNLRCFIRDSAEEIIAEWNTYILARPVRLTRGRNKLRFTWTNMRLAPGCYSIEIIAYEADGLQIAASLHIENYITIDGDLNGPAKISLGYPDVVSADD